MFSRVFGIFIIGYELLREREKSMRTPRHFLPPTANAYHLLCSCVDDHEDLHLHTIAIAPPSNIMQRHLSLLSSVVLAFCRHHTANSFNPTTTTTTMVVSTRSSSLTTSPATPAVISTLTSTSAASAAASDAIPGPPALDADDSNNPKKKNIVDSPSSPSTKTPEWVGQPEEPFLAGIKGWTKRTFRRQNGASAGTRLDSYWYSPGGHKFRSTTEVKKFLKCLEENNDDEEAAYQNFKSVPSPMSTPPKKTPTTMDFTAFAATTEPSTNSNDNPGQKSKKRSPSRWNVVTPSKKARSPTSSSSTKKKKKSPSKKSGPATQSFGALTAANFTNLNDTEIEVHTLILGTHPSIKSLSEDQYFGHAMNAFWWIAGDCLGFRRNEGVSPATGKPYALAKDLRYDNTQILPYEKQIELFCSKGFALWDIVASCHRPGSLDSDITKDKPNDIPSFCQQHPRIRRIVLANGVSGCKFFKKHFNEWLDSGRVVPDPNDDVALSQFKKWGVPKEETHSKIQLVSALAVSPAAAKHPYVAKRNFWEQFVYKPGLADFEISSKQ